MSQNYDFEFGTIVSLPEIGDLDMAASCYAQNSGLEQSLREGRTRIRILSLITDIMNGMTNPTSVYYRTFVTTPTMIDNSMLGQGNDKNADVADLTPARVHNTTRTNSNGEDHFEGATFSDVVIITDCDTKMAVGTAIENSTLIITSTSNDTVSSPQAFRLGVNDNCVDGGGAQLSSFGDVQGASKLQIYGSQIMAVGDVKLSANNNGIEGASIVAGGEISIASQSDFGFCGGGMGDTFQAEYFRMATWR